MPTEGTGLQSLLLWRKQMQNVQLRGLLKVHKDNRRSENEQARELAHLRSKRYRGVPTNNLNWISRDNHGKTFKYRGVEYTA